MPDEWIGLLYREFPLSRGVFPFLPLAFHPFLYIEKGFHIIYWKFKDTNHYIDLRTSKVVLVVKNPPAKAGVVRDSRSLPGSGRFPGGGHGNPLQYSCLESPMDRGAWRAAVHGVTKSRTRLKRLSTHHSAPSLDLSSPIYNSGVGLTVVY